MKQLFIYPIEAINIGKYHYYSMIDYYQAMSNEWEGRSYNILFHRDMSYGVSFIYKGYNHLFTYYNHTDFNNYKIAVYRERYSIIQGDLFQNFYNYSNNYSTYPFSLYTDIIGYIEYIYRESINSTDITIKGI